MDNKGWIKLHRQLMEMPEWLAEPFTRGQAWVDLLLLANHKTGYIRKRGILIAVDRGQVGYSERSLAERWQWSRDKVRRFLLELTRLSRVSRGTSEKTIPKNTSVSNLICIINYEKYQMNDTENDTEGNTENDTRTRMKRIKRNTPEEIFSEIQLLENKYSDRNLVNQCFKAMSSTRKTNRISDSVKLNILQQWDKYPVNQVMAGIKIYLEKDYAATGKDEKYLLGIIRGSSKQTPADVKEDAKESTSISTCPRCQAQIPPQDRFGAGCIHCEPWENLTA